MDNIRFNFSELIIGDVLLMMRIKEKQESSYVLLHDLIDSMSRLSGYPIKTLPYSELKSVVDSFVAQFNAFMETRSTISELLDRLENSDGSL